MYKTIVLVLFLIFSPTVLANEVLASYNAGKVVVKFIQNVKFSR